MYKTSSSELSSEPTIEPQIGLRMMGGFEVSLEGTRVALTPAAQRLVAFLAIERRAVARSVVAGRLFGDRSDAQAGAALRTALWRANSCVTIVDSAGGPLALSGRVRVDYQVRLRAADRVLRSDGTLRPAAFEDLLREDLLPDWYDEWVAPERERFRQRRLHLCDEVIEALIARGHTGEAIDLALSTIGQEPFREKTQQLLIHAHLSEGNRAEALRQFERFDVLMRDEMGLPADSTLRAQIMSA